MRIRNKEIKQRRHRKDQIIKAAIKEAKANKSEKPAAEKAAPKKPAAPKKTAEAGAEKKAPAKKAAPKKAAEAPAPESAE